MIETAEFRPEAFRRKLLLAAGLSDEEYLQAFWRELGVNPMRPIFIDKMGGRLWVGRDAFIQRADKTIKINKQGRGPYMRAVARTIADPDEIWVNAEYITTAGRMNGDKSLEFGTMWDEVG